MKLLLIFLTFFASFHEISGDTCPNQLSCWGRCCVSEQIEYSCCPTDQVYSDGQDSVYVVSYPAWRRQQWGALFGVLIASIVISFIIVLLCCLFRTGCYLHKRRRPDLYSNSYPMYGVIYTNYPPPPPMYDGTPGHAFETTGQQHRVHFVPKATQNSYTTPPYPNAPTAPPRSPPRY